MPASQHIVAERYARALFALAGAAHAEAAVEKELGALAALVCENQELSRFVDNPLVPRAGKAAAFDAILAKANAHAVTRQFVSRLALNRRLDALCAVAEAFETLMNETRGEVTADIHAARALSSSDEAALTASLSQALARKVKARTSVDASLLGGVTVHVAGRMIDYSLKSQLNRLEKQLKHTVAH